MNPRAEQGIIIPVKHIQGAADYMLCATWLARSIRCHSPTVPIALLTDHAVDNTHEFDYVVPWPYATVEDGWANDWQVFWASPFRETIKLEADMLLTSSLDHWWSMLRHRDVVVSHGCHDWHGKVSHDRHYRSVFDANHLPDVYNACTYWRLSQTAKNFFELVRDIFQNWKKWSSLLAFPEDRASTDVVYAMACRLIGEESCTMPFAQYPRITHMKKHIAGIRGPDWTKELTWELDGFDLRINTVSQSGLVHYHVKEWLHGF